MRIVAVHERAVPIASSISNAFISFATMNASAVAVVSDVVRDGRSLVGYGFNSNGRYAQSGLLRDRFIPRLLAADPMTLLEEDGFNFDPARIWDTLMADEKPGGHGERSVAPRARARSCAPRQTPRVGRSTATASASQRRSSAKGANAARSSTFIGPPITKAPPTESGEGRSPPSGGVTTRTSPGQKSRIR
jgi:hypothetical protein